MANDAKFGLLAGLVTVLLIAVSYYPKRTIAPQATPAATPAATTTISTPPSSAAPIGPVSTPSRTFPGQNLPPLDPLLISDTNPRGN